MFQSSFRIHVLPEQPIDWKRIPGSNLAARLELVMDRNMRKGDALPTPRGLLLHHDSAARKATVKGRLAESCLCFQEHQGLWPRPR
jgi:hypothetical protein